MTRALLQLKIPVVLALGILTPQILFGASPCGFGGSFTDISSRIRDCNTQVKGKYKFTFSLVSRSDLGKEVWRDDQTNLLWGDFLAQQYTFDESIDLNESICHHEYMSLEQCEVRKELSCRSADAFAANAEIGEVEFSLPTTNEVIDVFYHGITKVNLKFNDKFWTSSFVSYTNRRLAWTFYAVDHGEGRGKDEFRDMKNKIRCVAR